MWLRLVFCMLRVASVVGCMAYGACFCSSSACDVIEKKTLPTPARPVSNGLLSLLEKEVKHPPFGSFF